MKIGAISSLQENNTDNLFGNLAAIGLNYTQLCCWDVNCYTDENAEKVIAQSKANNVNVCALWAGYSGKVVWGDFELGPVTLGVVPPASRKRRVADLKKGADFAKKIGAPAIITHCGFLPENICDPEYAPVRDAIEEVALYCKSLGLDFWFETGQETPIVLLRIIEEIGSGNIGINLDPANLIMYGKGNPIDALETFGKYVKNLHVKDGLPPTTGRSLGPEVQVGKGVANFPLLMAKLKNLNFDGEFIIEREINDTEEQTRDIQETVTNLKKWWGEE